MAPKRRSPSPWRYTGKCPKLKTQSLDPNSWSDADKQIFEEMFRRMHQHTPRHHPMRIDSKGQLVAGLWMPNSRPRNDMAGPVETAVIGALKMDPGASSIKTCTVGTQYESSETDDEPDTVWQCVLKAELAWVDQMMKLVEDIRRMTEELTAVKLAELQNEP